MATLTVGAALGAGAMYLLDPEHGQHRRRSARRAALAQAQQRSLQTLQDAREQVRSLTVAAIDGFQEGRAVAPTVDVDAR